MRARRIGPRQIGLAVLAVLVAAGLGLRWYVGGKRQQLALGVGYAARVACGCRYLSGRSLASCYGDFEPGMDAIRLHDDPAAKAVTASVPLAAHRTVRFDPVLGCQPEPYRGERLIVHPAAAGASR